MRLSLIVAIAVLIVWLVLAWFLGTWLHLHGSDIWILRIGLAVIGIAGFGAYVWMTSRRGAPIPASAGGTEVDLLMHEADAKLHSSKLARIAELPAILLLGESGSAKTTTVFRSGLDPELLAGEALQDGSIVPTRALNVWLGQNLVLVDPGGASLNDAGARRRLLRSLGPKALKSVVGKSGTAPRAALVCVDCSTFIGSGGMEAGTRLARQLRETLGEMSQTLGIRLPVYVLFTKLDKLEHFFEYVGNLTEPETSQVLGVTLPMEDATRGVYAERETKRLTDAFLALHYSLCDRRPEFLAREHDAAKLPSIYEFPREFRKMRAALIQFLVDLCRPSQLSTNPFLRGFYFTGVRPLTISDVAAAAPAPTPVQTSFDPEATRVFSAALLGGKQQSPAQVMAPATRRVPQWVFLKHVFANIVLKDQSAQSSSSSNLKLNLWRRVLLVTLSALALVAVGLWTISFFNNQSLEQEAVKAARAIQNDDVQPGQLASIDSLRRLEDLRKPLARIADYRQTQDHPMTLGFGLYSGDRIYDPLRRVYLGAFRRLLLNPTKMNLVDLLSRPGSADSSYVYQALKAYLITTSNPEKSTADFLPPVLVTHWLHGQPADERANLAKAQFEFYAEDLRLNPTAGPRDEPSVKIARDFLTQTGAIEPLYQGLIKDGLKDPWNFNDRYPGSAEVVINRYPIPKVFTKAGWIDMRRKIQDPSKYPQGESWVLGEEAAKRMDLAAAQQALTERYRKDFLKTWRDFLRNTTVVRYGSFNEAATKLTKLTGNRSPLLLALCEVSENTSVDDDVVKKSFVPPQSVTPVGCSGLLAGPSNAAYTDGLIRLQAILQTLAGDQTNQGYRSQASTTAGEADAEVRRMARSFPPDKDGEVDINTQSLLLKPIDHVKALLTGLPAQNANAGAKNFCTAFNSLMTKYPFAPKGAVEAKLDEVSAVFKPKDGALWKLYEEVGKNFLDQQGADYRPKPVTPTATAEFARFFSRAAAMSNAFFDNGAAQAPTFSFSIRAVPNKEIEEVTLKMGAANFNFKGDNPAAQKVTWNMAGPQEITLQGKLTGGGSVGYPTDDSKGVWALSRLFASAANWRVNGSQSVVDFPLLGVAGGPVRNTTTGNPIVFHIEMDSGAFPMVLRPGSGFACVPAAVK